MRKIGVIGMAFLAIAPVVSIKEIEEKTPSGNLSDSIEYKSKNFNGNHKDGRANRRERRKQQRKKK